MREREREKEREGKECECEGERGCHHNTMYMYMYMYNIHVYNVHDCIIPSEIHSIPHILIHNQLSSVLHSLNTTLTVSLSVGCR